MVGIPAESGCRTCLWKIDQFVLIGVAIRGEDGSTLPRLSLHRLRRHAQMARAAFKNSGRRFARAVHTIIDDEDFEAMINFLDGRDMFGDFGRIVFSDAEIVEMFYRNQDSHRADMVEAPTPEHKAKAAKTRTTIDLTHASGLPQETIEILDDEVVVLEEDSELGRSVELPDDGNEASTPRDTAEVSSQGARMTGPAHDDDGLLLSTEEHDHVTSGQGIQQAVGGVAASFNKIPGNNGPFDTGRRAVSETTHEMHGNTGASKPHHKSVCILRT